MYAYKNENIRKKILSIRDIQNVSYSKYKEGKNADPKTIQLNIPPSSMEIIEQCQEHAMSEGILRDIDKVEVPGQLIHLNDTFKIELRLKGDYPDHWEGDKWSYRIKVKKGNRFLGMKSFSVQDPTTRNHLAEWYFHKFLAEADLIALRYNFVEIIENGENKGIYAVEESFDKQLIEFNDRREAPVLKFDESILIDRKLINQDNSYSQTDLYKMSKIGVFKTNRTLKDSSLYDQFQKGKSLLNQLRERTISLEKAVDIDKAARLFAITDIIGSHHSIRWKNMRFYYNPVLGKLELIGFDSNSGSLITDIYYYEWRNNTMGSHYVSDWQDVFFEEDKFVSLYFKYLKLYSSEKFLSDFHSKIQSEMELFRSYMYRDNSFYNFSFSTYEQNAAICRQKIQEYENSRLVKSNEYFVEAVAASPINLYDENISVTITNMCFQPIEIIGIFNPFEEQLSSNESVILEGKEQTDFYTSVTIPYHLNFPIDTNQMKFKINKDRWVHKKIKLGYSFLNQTDTFYTKIEAYYNPDVKVINYDVPNYFKINDKNRTVSVQKGSWIIDESVNIPKGYDLIIEGGTEIDLTNGALISVNGALLFNGTIENPIKIFSSDTSGTILSYQSKTRSKASHTIFEGLAESNKMNLHLSGGTNFYESDVDLISCTFQGNNSEDALNIVRSNFNIKSIKFIDISADAFDGDFCIGELNGAEFSQIGNDALDFSGSSIHISNVHIKGVFDKGVSAGERSRIVGDKITIEGSEI